MITISRREFFVYAVSWALLFGSVKAWSQSAAAEMPNLMHVDASTAGAAPDPTSFKGGISKNPRGDTLGMNSRFLTLNGRPWLPVMGEFHYTRVPEADWEAEILKMKAAGVSIIATYVIWIHHEEVEGQFDWTGNRDLHRFVELCGKHGMYVYPRIGPWAHGEARNGGFPDWLLAKTKDTRSNDPAYLSYVSKYYVQVAEQLKGELWKDGGPVIGIQIENEYARRGAGAGEDYIRNLKKIAVQDGIDVPVYSVTGWDGAVLPHGEFVAVFGGYPDAPWDASLKRLPPQEVYAFRFGSRVTGNMGAIGLAKISSRAPEHYDFPFMTAEMGGGVQDTYHRRPVIEPDDVAAMVPVMLGSGVNLYGSYMFQGGENPDGKLTTLQESQVTHYPTDVPVKSYDFQAPLGEFGDERPVLRKLKVFNYFMEDFGSELAPMEAFAPSIIPTRPEDLNISRIAVRTNGTQGFLFFNNYARDAAMRERTGFQVSVKLPRSTLTIPESPVTLPSGSYGIWPFNLAIGSASLDYATAQLFTKTYSDKGQTYYFEQTAGVSPEFVFENVAGTELEVHGGTRTEVGNKIVIRNLAPSLKDAITIRHEGKDEFRIVLLDPAEAENVWKLEAGETRHLIATDDQFYSTGNAAVLTVTDKPNFTLQVRPTLEFHSIHAKVTSKIEGNVSSFSAQTKAEQPNLTIKQIAAAIDIQPVKVGPSVSWRASGVAIAPQDSDFSSSAKWSLALTPSSWNGVEDLWLDVDYDGDVARLYSGGKLLVDNFYNGQVWHVGLKRFREQIAKGGLELEILPRRQDAPIFLEHPDSSEAKQVLNLRGVTVHPEYQITLSPTLSR